MTTKLKRSTRRLLLLLALIPVAVLVLASIYKLGMDHLEHSPRTFLESMQWATETLTTTGYGGDNKWHHPAVALFVMLGQFIGQFLVFLIFPFAMLPYVEEKFEVRLPHALPPMTGKVLFYGFGPPVESLLEQFRRTDSPFVILEDDMDKARRLRDRGYDVVFGKLAENPSVLAGVHEARALVACAGDHANATCTLLAREAGYAGPLFALADDPLYRAPMIQIGATDVFTPAHVLGSALASRASTRISPPAEGMQMLGAKVGLAEFRVGAGSPLAGKRLAELQLRERHGVTVVGQWHGGAFATPRGPDMRIEPGAIIVVAGVHADLEAVERMAMPIRRTGPIVLAGYGMVGHKVIEVLTDAGESCVVIDAAAGPGVDVVGNVLDQRVLQQAGVRDASAMILALSDDAESVFATAAVREFAPDLPLIVRVQRTPNTARIYLSGADFAISVGEVAGQILAFSLFDELLTHVENRLRFARLSAGRLAGTHPWRTDVLKRTGAQLIAVERGQEVLVEFEDSFVVEPDDALLVCGGIDSLEVYQREFQATPARVGRVPA